MTRNMNRGEITRGEITGGKAPGEITGGDYQGKITGGFTCFDMTDGSMDPVLYFYSSVGFLL